MEKEKKGCLIPLAFLAAGIISFCIGLAYDIHILYVLGFLIPAYGGTIYSQYTGKKKKWSIMKHILVSFLMLLIAAIVCFILYGKLW